MRGQDSSCSKREVLAQRKGVRRGWRSLVHTCQDREEALRRSLHSSTHVSHTPVHSPDKSLAGTTCFALLEALLVSHCLIDALMLVRHLLCGNERYLRGTETLRPLWHLLLLPHTLPCNSSLACTHASLVAHVWARQADGPHLTILARHLQSTPCNILFRRMTPHPHIHY